MSARVCNLLKRPEVSQLISVLHDTKLLPSTLTKMVTLETNTVLKEVISQPRYAHFVELAAHICLQSPMTHIKGLFQSLTSKDVDLQRGCQT